MLVALGAVACDDATDAGASSSGTLSTTSASTGTGPVRPAALTKLDGFLQGSFDNQAQVDGGFSKLVQRFVCALPNRVDDPDALWLYTEHVEVLSNGQRDAYFTRVNEIRIVNGSPVSRAYKFVPEHPLATDAFKLNGERDGCLQPEVLAAITESDLVYREGCDVTFVEDGEVFDASTTGMGCTFPGGYITTTATVFADGLDTQDVAVSGGQMTGDSFEFRRVASP